MRPSAVACAGALLVVPLLAQQSRRGLADLPEPRATRALQFSSWDRGGGNEDTGNFLRVEPDGTRVLAEVDGPGRVVRIWSANPDGALRIELDGEAIFDGPFARLFDQTLPPFERPLAGRWGGGFVSHVPLPFVRSLRVTCPPGPAFYYQIGVELGAQDERFALPPGPVVRRDIAALVAGARTRDEGSVVSRRDVEVGARCPLFARDGAGELLELRLAVRHGDGDGLWLEVRFEGAAEAAVAAPVDELFATLPTQLGDRETLRLPMPFRRRCDVALVDRALDRTVPVFVDFDAVFRELPPDHERLWLHAEWHRAPTVWGEPFRALDTTCRGHFVGLIARLHGGSGHGLSFLEGDETIAVDGEVAFRGTGTEDFFSGAWYFRSGTFRAPFHALSELDPDGERVAVSRFFVADPIPFRSSFRFDLEHGGQNDTPGADYRTIAFWYSDSPAGAAIDEGRRPATAARTTITQPAALRWPAHTTAAAGTTLPAGELTLPRDSVVTLYHRGRTVLGPVWLEGDAAAAEIVAPLAVDRVRIEPILPAIRAWRIAGPFPGGDRKGLDRTFGPEQNADGDRRYDDIVGDGERGWRDLPNRPWPVGYVDLNPLFAPNDEVVAFAVTEIESPRAQDGVLWLGSDDAVRVFLNGAPIHEHRGLRGAARDQDRVEVHLRQGRNRLMLEVEDYFGGFGLFARIEGAEGLTFAAR
ncbi:MAG: DUF2961 domain-containing protein [Planctomycetes bacterium]|nr:DUF2961 domain-containing protein [Planctomycetota bacterium]